MSVEAMSFVLNRAMVNGTDKLVLLGIASHADKYGDNAWPSVDTLAGYANVSHRATQQSLARLADMGWIEIQRQAGGTAQMRADRRPNLYRIIGVKQLAPREPSRGEAQRGHGVKPSAPRGEAGFTQNVLKPSVEPSKENVAAAPLAFEAFWQTYPPRNGRKVGKDDAKKQWAKLSSEERQLAILGAANLRDETRSGLTFAPDAHRWLRKRSWEDWQTPRQPGGNVQPPTFPDCGICDNAGWVDSDDGYVKPCPGCERVPA